MSSSRISDESRAVQVATTLRELTSAGSFATTPSDGRPSGARPVSPLRRLGPDSCGKRGRTDVRGDAVSVFCTRWDVGGGAHPEHFVQSRDLQDPENPWCRFPKAENSAAGHDLFP